jgi:hypothetical protein
VLRVRATLSEPQAFRVFVRLSESIRPVSFLKFIDEKYITLAGPGPAPGRPAGPLSAEPARVQKSVHKKKERGAHMRHITLAPVAVTCGGGGPTAADCQCHSATPAHWPLHKDTVV